MDWGILILLQFSIVITIAQDAPFAKVEPTYLDLDFNAADNVTCTTYGNNVAGEWLRTKQVNGQTELEKVPTEKIQGRFQLTPQGLYQREWTLMFKDVTEADAGSYICKVTADTKPTFREVDVAVKPAQAPQIRKFPAQVTKENVRTSLNCRSNGAPKPKIQFFKDGVEITSGSNGYVIDGRKLHIEKPKFPEHDGVYTCSVTNMFGKATKKSSLTVTVAPIIEKKQSIVVVGSEDKLKIACNITRSNPVPNITWQYQPWSCQESKGYNCDPISTRWQTADPAKLDIKPRTPNTMYSVFKVPTSNVKRFFVRCTAKHKYGQDTHQVIGIIDKRNAENLLRSSPSFETNEREPFKLECTGGAGLFLNLTWKKDDKEIQLTDRMTLRKTGSILENQQIVLSVGNSTPADSGFYKCIGVPARPEDGLVIVGTQVVINKIYAPRLTSLKQAEVRNDENAIITCYVDSHPTAAVTWFKEGKQLVVETIDSIDECSNRDEGKYFELVDNSKNTKPKRHRLVICKSQWKINNGTYSCEAKNNLGMARQQTTVLVFAPPKIVYAQFDEYPSPEKSYSRNCTTEGNPLPIVWWEKEINGNFVLFSSNYTTGVSFLNITKFEGKHYGTYRCVASNVIDEVVDTMTLKKPVLVLGGYGSNNGIAQTASLVAALVVAVLIIIILVVLAVILYKRKRLYGGFYILSIPPSPDYFKKLDPTRPLSDQTNKLPYFPEWEYPRNKIKLKNCVGAGAFGEVYIADAIGICAFDPRYKIGAKHKPLLYKKRFSFTKSKLARQDSVASTRSSRSTKSLLSKSGDRNAVVAVKKLKENASTVEYKDLIAELKILIHIGQNKHIVNLLGACTKGIEMDSMVILEFCPHGNLLSFVKSRRQIFKPVWSKQHLGMEKEFTLFDLCVAGYQVAKGLEFLADRKCVHRDVAARNVLVGENYVMKIADFGLARDVYEDERYVKVSGGLLPIKWMALESIVDRVFTHASDVWSFGVLMWEVMTLGGGPYPGIAARELPEFLSSGGRMEQPPRCPNEVFQLMLETWNELPDHRPTFNDIVMRLASVVEAHCNPQDIPHYLDKEHVSGNNSDYLRPVDSDVGSYKINSSSSYASSLGRNDDVFRRHDSSTQSERYVPDNRFNDNEVSERLLGDFSNKDVNDGASDKSIEAKPKMDEMVSEKDYKKVNGKQNGYENDTGSLKKKNKKNKQKSKETKLEMEENEKDINEKDGLLNGGDRTPSEVEEFSSFIDGEYEKMDNNEGYING
ncbi:fibroblast growth factor receptor 2-like isoform X2 [Clytia hemisphaerica]|uniref:receptor protein-tyrosine kinase n=1 Tax=Clytia hemisphaerica TaxID=252671 RepID=A0A7M5X7D7_9CNID